MRPTAGSRRGAALKDSLLPDRNKPPPTPIPLDYTFPHHRDSDVSLCSSRPSASNHRIAATTPISDRSHQTSAIRTINSFLSSHSCPFSLKPPLPSAKDIIETLKFVIQILDFPVSNKLEEDLFVVIRALNCPIKLNKSALKAPGTPHSWPGLLGVIHWLVQIGMYNEYLVNGTSERLDFDENGVFGYALRSYLCFIRGDDDGVENEDEVFLEKLRREKEAVEENLGELGRNVEELEGMRGGKSEKKVLEEEKRVLEEDVRKFGVMIGQLDEHIVNVGRVLEEKERELEVKIAERRKIVEENEELKRRVEEQVFNARDVERMRKELQAVERGIGEAEAARNGWDEKGWDVEEGNGKKFKDLQNLMIECNQAIRKLKLGNGFQYELNAKGSTPAEVLGIDYKSTLKPALAAFADDIKKSSMARLEELISLQQLSVETEHKIEVKRNHIVALQSHIDEVEVQLNLMKNEMQEITSRCVVEARNLVQDVEAETHNLDLVEREATELLKNSQAKLQEATLHGEEEVQMCAQELFALVDSVSTYKEYMTSKISEMNDYVETMHAISDLHKGSLLTQFGCVYGAANNLFVLVFELYSHLQLMLSSSWCTY